MASAKQLGCLPSTGEGQVLLVMLTAQLGEAHSSTQASFFLTVVGGCETP
jgi:hypothetical protein